MQLALPLLGQSPSRLPQDQCSPALQNGPSDRLLSRQAIRFLCEAGKRIAAGQVFVKKSSNKVYD
ncbi:hypothetical protein TMES_02635 [Thalassospira mesophila]|uniref:Uncharacterized protein n=2 Tax=Thalassospira mesophila TaxID=1293891 RepID=A0A1Y2L4A3_9PROT|nr:hypothetical protein TMES_02635 [Thalassospira mesophila]